MSNSWELLKNGDYQSALVAYSDEIKSKPKAPAYNNRATAHLLLGELDEALADFAVAGYLELIDSISSDHAPIYVGAVLWLKGLYRNAAAVWQNAIEKSSRRGYTHSDAAGGVRCGCLLWFAGASLHDSSLCNVAETYLQERLEKRKKVGIPWPGAIAKTLLGQLSVQQLLDSVDNGSALFERHSCQAQFYSAAFFLKHEQSLQASLRFKAVAETKAFIEIEYFLAVHETARMAMPST